MAERLNNLELSGRLEGCAARDGNGKEGRGKVVLIRGAVAKVGADKAGRRRGAGNVPPADDNARFRFKSVDDDDKSIVLI